MQAFARTCVAFALLTSILPLTASAQSRGTPNPSSRSRADGTPPGTLVIAGEQEQAPITRIGNHPYVDIESLARITHATVRYVGNQIILTLPNTPENGGTTATSERPPQLSRGFLTAEIEALTAIREWRVSLVNAVQYQYPISENWIAPLRRFADEKLQLAAAAASTEPDHKTLELLRNEFSNMQQESDSVLALRARVSEIRPDMFDNNAQDQKILACERALAQVAASKQFQDDPACH